MPADVTAPDLVDNATWEQMENGFSVYGHSTSIKAIGAFHQSHALCSHGFASATTTCIRSKDGRALT
jgi:hypothetical protein